MTRYTPAEEAWLREHYRHGTVDDTLDAFEREFGRRPSKPSLATKATAMGLRKDSSTRYVKWTPERVAWFRAFAPGHTEREISAEHERVFGTPLAEGQIGNAKTRFGVKSGTHGGRFERGNVPANKGRTWDEQGIPPEVQERMRGTCFKPGEVRDRPGGWLKPVGHERVNRDGYVEVKVRDSRESGPRAQGPGRFNENYRMKHHVVWERANGGPVPPHTMIVFADRDKRNFDPGNLVAVPRGLWVRICKSGAPYYDRDSLEACMAAAALQNAAGRAARRPRACGCCGAEFEPRYPHQRTCDACLEAGRRAPRRREATAGA